MSTLADRIFDSRYEATAGRQMPSRPWGQEPRAKWQQVIVSTDLPVTTKAVALVLSTLMNSDGQCFPDQATIASMASLKPRAVRNHLRTLVDGGWLLVVRRGHGLGNGDAASSRYQASAPD